MCINFQSECKEFIDFCSRENFAKVEILVKTLKPLSEAIGKIEAEEGYLSETFFQIIKFGVRAINIGNSIKALFLKRWSEIDMDLFLASYYLDPQYKSMGIKYGNFSKILQSIINVSKRLNFSEEEISELIALVQRYKSSQIPYNAQYSHLINSLIWWESIEDVFGDTLKKLAIALLKVPASSASVERMWSIAGWIQSDKRKNRMNAETLEMICQIRGVNIQNLTKNERTNTRHTYTQDEDLSIHQHYESDEYDTHHYDTRDYDTDTDEYYTDEEQPNTELQDKAFNNFITLIDINAEIFVINIDTH